MITKTILKKGYVYILECSDGSYYTGSTIDLEKRINEHKNGLGANHTKKRLPVKLVFFEEFTRIDEAFQREKQIQGWNRNKKEALIHKNYGSLPDLSIAYRDRDIVPSSASGTVIVSDDLVPEALEGTSSNRKINKQTFTSNGKLLLTGEYVVLDGAISFAVPTKYGQSLVIEETEDSMILWKSFDDKQQLWFEGKFELSNGVLKQLQHDEVSNRLKQIFEAVNTLNPSFLKSNKGFKVETHLDFPKNWGLGTSSTLINNIAQWTNVNAFKLLELTFGGSGYDIACAQNNTPITYQLENKSPFVEIIDFNPNFKEHLYFVYLNKKQNSREGIAHYKAQDKKYLRDSISEINTITSKIISSNNLEGFKILIGKHESIISKITNQKPVKKLFFNDFNGSIKSLGAWGGDFILVASNDNPEAYFKSKGYTTIIPYKDMVL